MLIVKKKWISEEHLLKKLLKNIKDKIELHLSSTIIIQITEPNLIKLYNELYEILHNLHDIKECTFSTIKNVEEQYA